MKLKRGFSLIEVVIAVTILGVIGVITSTLFSKAYQGSNKSQLVTKIKQNGQLALGMLDAAIRSSDGVVCYGVKSDGVTNDKLVIRTKAGKFIKFRFIDPDTYTKTNGYIAKDENLQANDISIFCTQPANLTSEVPLTDNSSTGINVSNGSFAKIAGNLSKDVVTIKFNVSPSLKAASSFDATTSASAFETTVQVR